VHINSVEVDGSSLLISMRHTDAIYSISRSDGHVEWKLGGTTTAQSLTVSGDPRTPTFGGQHDARRLADGTVTIHDNGTQLGRPPRGVRYRIDETAKTASLVESVTDPEVTVSLCCGSARKLDSGGWLMGWGTLTSPVIAEYASTGSRVFKLQVPNGFSYRAFPVPSGRVSAGELRQAMDSMFPR
jgi:arylsulfotransferase ASST